MPMVHGKDVYLSLDTTDISHYCNNTEWNREADSHDTTTYGATAHTFKGGLKNGTATIGGFYDSDATAGPKATIEPMVGTVVELIHRPEGTGDGLPEDTVSVLVLNYQQTEPVADMITWTAELQFSGDVTTTSQSTV